jgi:hypothetical protein
MSRARSSACRPCSGPFTSRLILSHHCASPAVWFLSADAIESSTANASRARNAARSHEARPRLGVSFAQQKHARRGAESVQRVLADLRTNARVRRDCGCRGPGTQIFAQLPARAADYRRMTRTFIGFLLVWAISSAASGAAAEPQSQADHAQPPTSRTREAGDTEWSLLVGLEAPGGSVGTGPDGRARDLLGLRVALSVDGGLRLAPKFRVSGRLTGFAGSLGDAFDEMCDAGREAERADPDPGNDNSAMRDETCAQFGAALGVHVRYDFREQLPVYGVSPWVSFGSGVETLKMFGSSGKSETLYGSFEGSLTGVNLAMPEIGLDWRAGEHAVIAIFANAKVGRYFSRSGNLRLLDEEIEAQYGAGAWHTWIGGGLALVIL